MSAGLKRYCSFTASSIRMVRALITAAVASRVRHLFLIFFIVFASVSVFLF